MLQTKQVQLLSPSVQTFSLSIQWLIQSPGIRLDANFYNHRAADAIAMLNASKFKLATLGSKTERIFFPGRFKRNYVDEKNGIPFLSGSHIVHFEPADLKYIAKDVQRKQPDLRIKQGWVLVTRSGTVGRVGLVGTAWDGWAASEHLLRIVPNSSVLPPGYISAFLASEFGQAQFNGVYGAVVDEITPEHLESILIPIATSSEQEKQIQNIHAILLESVRLKEQALANLHAAVKKIDELIPVFKGISSSNITYDRPIVFSVDSNWLAESASTRLDAGFYNPRAALAVRVLKQSGLPLKTLGQVTQKVFTAPRFKRIYVTEQYGIPFLQGRHVVQFQPADIKYLSKIANKKLERWTIEPGWILVTCSGTIGRVTMALPSWNGWAASQHIMRIIPNTEYPAGYIYAFLSSALGQAQFNGIYGAVVDELTDNHAKTILIPVPEKPEQKAIIHEIDRLALESIKIKEEAIDKARMAVNLVNEMLKPRHF